jgi:DNA-binding transcriptional LysR family regulator
MNRGDLNDLNTFLAIADHLSFRAAAAQLGVTSSALSHSIRQLEERLGVRLLHRTTRSVLLTDSGLRLMERLRPGMDQISNALEELKEVRHRPSRRLRIYTQHWAAATVVAPVWQQFLSSYPDVHLELCVESGMIFDTVAGGFDAGLAVRDRVPDEMIAVRATGPMEAAVVASPSYFTKHPQPRTPDDLASHQCVLYRIGRVGEIFRWRAERQQEGCFSSREHNRQQRRNGNPRGARRTWNRLHARRPYRTVPAQRAASARSRRLVA